MTLGVDAVMDVRGDDIGGAVMDVRGDDIGGQCSDLCEGEV